MIRDLFQDLRVAARRLRRHRSHTITTLAALGLGLGATTAIFSVISGVMLKPLPFAQPERLVRVYETTPFAPEGGGVGWADLGVFRGQNHTFDGLAGYGTSGRFVRGPRGAERLLCVQAERGLFVVLGVSPLAGRTFGADDPHTVVVIGEAFWRRQFGGDRSAIGSALELDGTAYTVIGVMSDAFQFPYGAASLLPGVASEARTDVWTLSDPLPGRQARGRLSVTGRLKPGVTLAAATADLSEIAADLARQYPDSNRDRGVRLQSLADAIVAPPIRRSLYLLFGAIGLVLAIACANVAVLSLVQLAQRHRELALRAALGAGRRRLVRQLLTETGLLTALGAAAGAGVAVWGLHRVMPVVFTQVPRAFEVAMDWRVFLFLAAASAATALVAGLVPALIVRVDLQSALKDVGGTGSPRSAPRRFRDGLVVAEVALAFVLAVGAGLLIRELWRLRQTDTGMTTGNVLTMHLGQRTAGADVREFYEIQDRVERLPGVRAAGLTQLLPLQSWGWTSSSADFRALDRPPADGARPWQIELRYVTPGYFRALGIPVRKGRTFTPRDTKTTPGVVLINETLARQMFGGDEPVGVTTNRGTIVGIVGDVRQAHLDRPSAPEIYYAMAQNWSQVAELGVTLIASTEGPPLAPLDSIRAIAREVNPGLAVFNVKTMDEVVADSLSDFRLYLSLVGAFAVLALVLVATGLYGVLAHLAALRARECAIRVALGADPRSVVRVVMGPAARLAVVGLAVGVTATFAGASVLRSLPVSVRAPDAAVVVPVAILMLLVATAASLVPAWRAARTDPMTVLRRD